jgi:hypothetical protein
MDADKNVDGCGLWAVIAVQPGALSAGKGDARDPEGLRGCTRDSCRCVQDSCMHDCHSKGLCVFACMHDSVAGLGSQIAGGWISGLGVEDVSSTLGLSSHEEGGKMKKS